MPMPAMVATGPASGPTRRRRGGALRKRRGLAFGRAPRQVQCLLQPLVLTAQPLALTFHLRPVALRPLQVPTQPMFSRSRSRIGSERFGTSRLCQIPEKSTRGNVRYGRVNPVTSYDFDSLADLETRLLAFQRHSQSLARPCEWTFTRRDSLARVLATLALRVQYAFW